MFCIIGSCLMKVYLVCFVKRFFQNNGEDLFLILVEGDCLICFYTFLWRDLMKYQNQIEQILDLNLDSFYWVEEFNRY